MSRIPSHRSVTSAVAPSRADGNNRGRLVKARAPYVPSTSCTRDMVTGDGINLMSSGYQQPCLGALLLLTIRRYSDRSVNLCSSSKHTKSIQISSLARVSIHEDTQPKLCRDGSGEEEPTSGTTTLPNVHRTNASIS